MAPPMKGGEGEGGVASGGGQQVINLAMLELPQLQQFKTQVESELNFYQDAVIQLKEVQNKMADACTTLNKLTPQTEKQLMVPVTASMFVRGELEDVNKMLIDIGTGYYVEKNLEDSIDYFERKVKFLQAQIEKVQTVGREKTKIRSVIMEIMEGKAAALIAAGKIPPPSTPAGSATAL